MKANDLRKKYIDFFKNKEHKLLTPAPIIPRDDSTTLFTPFGMQQLVPYLKGEIHPMGTRLVNSQPCFRAEDIEEVGNKRHTTFFEMLGNWSLGDYFKKEQLSWFLEFLTEIGIPKEKLHTTYFEGSKDIPKDTESLEIWKDLGIPEDKIHAYPAEKNWWSTTGIPENMPAGDIGGPDSEVFYDYGTSLKLHENSQWKNRECHVNCDCGRYVELGNSVFMQYEKQKDGTFKPLPKKNVDFGGGFERILTVVQGKQDIFETDLFQPIIKTIEEYSDKKYEGKNKEQMRVIADHLRASSFMIAEGIEPSNKLQGYFLRRLLRRSAVKLNKLNKEAKIELAFKEICKTALKQFIEAGFISNEKQPLQNIEKSISSEITQFTKAMNKGLRILNNTNPKSITPKLAFDLYQTHGFPLEVTQEILKEKGIDISKDEFNKELEKHKELSRTSSAGMFKGGLADESGDAVKLHTATHILHQSLRNILGNHVQQVGSNITSERLRFDYEHSEKPTDDQIQKIQSIINNTIAKDFKVTKSIANKQEALESGALAFFAEKYPEKVSVYTIGNDNEKPFSKELCGGPHVSSTGEIGSVTIKKEESLGAGKRRVYAILKKP